MSSLNPKDYEDFWIRVYLNPKGNILNACADRAYRDFNRTIHGIGKEQSNTKYQKVREVMMNISEKLIGFDFKNQDSFDQSHKSQCDSLIDAFDIQYQKVKITPGQAQKWINMYLKYLTALGETRVPSITKNYQFFHIPIDNIIQDILLNKQQIKKIPIAWSRIEEYDTYLNYQKLVRKVFDNHIPMDIEFKLFNQESNA